MTLRDYARSLITRLLDESPVVVWYDPERDFAELAAGFELPDCTVVRWDGSHLRTRRAAEKVYAGLYPPEPPGARGNRLLLYLPQRRPASDEKKRLDPFEAFALTGTSFGDSDAHSLLNLACKAMPQYRRQIERLFEGGRPSLAQLDHLALGERRPALREALGTESIVDAAAVLLCRPERRERLDETAGARAELLEGLATEIGFRPPASVSATKTPLDYLARYVLLSELLFDLPDGPPASLNAVPHAEPAYRERIFALCDRMRADAMLRPGYVERALAVERELQIAAAVGAVARLGERDTFACEEGRYFTEVVERARSGDLEAARTIVAGRAGSVWREHEERTLLWKVAERCVAFLDVARQVETALLPAAASVKKWVNEYTREDGFWRLDYYQRLFEQGEAETAHHDEIEPLITLCRGRYRTVAEKMQKRFLDAVERDGWPPDGVQRHTETFVRAVQPELDAGQRVAYFFVDAMRFEMGKGLARELDQDLGEARVIPAAGVLPATTPCGMAALLPGAETGYRLLEERDEIVPSIDGKLLPNSASRMEYLRGIYGDRFGEAALEDVLRFPSKKLAEATREKRLFVVRTQDIDGIAENLSGYQARKLMSDVLADLRKATLRLARLGFQAFIYAGDHGHVLLPELEHGNQVAKPNGHWLKEKRRSLVGSLVSGGTSARVLSTARLGIPTDQPDFAVPPGFSVFTGGETYFHEGISLQENVVPVAILHARAGASTDAGVPRVSLSYRSDKFTSYIISIKALVESSLDTMLSGGVVVRIGAYDGKSDKANLVGEAADCDARNPETKLVTLPPGQEMAIPIRIEDGYQGETIEVRATDPDTGTTLATLRLKNAVQD